MKFDFEKYQLLALLFLADLSFIILHIFHVYTGLLPDSLYSLSRDRGYAEFFQYTKELWIAVLFLGLAIHQRKPVYLIFSFLFLYFLIDDSFEFHEQTGALLADTLHLEPLFGLRSVDMGELAVSVFFGGLFFAALGITYAMSAPGEQKISTQVILLIVIMAVFGVLLDMFEIITEHPGLSELLKILEEGGEMLVMSVITWFVYRLGFRG
jgi:hypothetical protein